jgi:Na+-transporting NADH:ubiquinone oxidoreductase subunit B
MIQRNMARVLLALLPVAVAGVYFFGWRVMAVLAVCNAAGVVTEFLTSRRRGAPVSMACFVTCCLLALSLPPTAPYWMVTVGAVVGILFGKEVFGGFGRNFANPAIVARAFLYVAFPAEMTNGFVPAFRPWPGGLVHWSMDSMAQVPQYLARYGVSHADILTQATPMLARSRYGYQTPTWDLLTGGIGDVFHGAQGTRVLAAGSIGEVSAILCVLAGVYLLVTRTANWRLMAAPLLGAIAANVLFRNVLGATGVPPVAFTLASGAMLYGIVFMVTEPVSAPKHRGAMWAYGAVIGFVIVLLRWRGQFVGAVAFAILLGNVIGPLLDLAAEALAQRRRSPGGAKGAAA